MQIQPIETLRCIQVNTGESIAQQLADLLKEYAAIENNPKEQLAVLMKLKAFLVQNESEIKEQCFRNGWRPGGKDWEHNYDVFFDHAISLIDAEEFNPQTPAHNSFDAIYSCLFTLETLMTTQKK